MGYLKIFITFATVKKEFKGSYLSFSVKMWKFLTMEADRYDDSSCIKVRGRYVFSIGYPQPSQ